jgi:hypothetical protein
MDRRISPIAILLLLLGCLTVFAYRAHRFADIEPRTDQAGHARLVQEIRIDHFLPAGNPDMGFRRRLEVDNASGLNRIARYVFVTPHFLFSSISLAFFYAGTFLSGYRWQELVVLSIAASTMTLGITTGWAYWICMPRREEPRQTVEALTGAAATFIAGAFSGYANLFSPWGLHNVGVLALVAAVFATSSALRTAQSANSRTRWRWAAAAQACAVYAHYTNIFLLPVATVAVLSVSPGQDRRQRVIQIATYGAMLLLITLPVIILLVLKPEVTVYAGYMGSPRHQFALHAVALRALGWISAGSRYFSIPGLVLGITGAAILCVRCDIWMPVLIIAAHWLAWTVIPGFSWIGAPTELRTYNYLLPFLWLGIGADAAFVLYGIRHGVPRTVVIGASAILFVIHLATQLPLFGSSAQIALRLPIFYDNYLCGEGRLRRIVSDIDSRVPHGATILAWDYPTQDVYYVLSSHRENGIVLETLWQRQRERALPEHLREYGYRVNCNSLYVVAHPEQEMTNVEQAVDAVLGPNGFKCSPHYVLRQIAAYPADADCDFLGGLVLSQLTSTPK